MELRELERGRYGRPCRHDKEFETAYNVILSDLCFKIILASIKNEREWEEEITLYVLLVIFLFRQENENHNISKTVGIIKDTASSKFIDLFNYLSLPQKESV